jgi:5-(carboxyamino)imidazole ribonucleotide synthase
MTAPLTPGARLGILGGGQLGRMIALAAAPLGIPCHIYAPEEANPAYDVAAAHTVAAYDDFAALARFAASVDAITYEFENVPVATVEFLAGMRPVHPSPGVLATTQDRLKEKRFVAGLGIPTASFAAVDDVVMLADAVSRIGLPAILKTRRFGYDGKGQATIADAGAAEAAFAAIGSQPSILEGFVPFAAEFSVILARSADGAIAPFDICENRHANHILRETRVPFMALPDDAASRALSAARRIASALDYRGVLAVEMFHCPDRPAPFDVVVNEIAPRVHNSGHWTIEGAQTSQFSQHVRAVLGWPLGSPARRAAFVRMTNLIGDDIAAWPELIAEAGAWPHHYGKSEARPGRKMGHVTRLSRESPSED